MNKKILMISAITAGILFTGCGSSDNGVEKPEAKKQIISGSVIDPAIKNSFVKICLKTDFSNCLTHNTDTTNSNGDFNITDISSDVNLSNYVVIANGGTDVETGEEFDDVNLTIPAGLADINGTVVVSPISTLLQANDWNKSVLATKLGLSSDDVLKDPRSIKKLQKTALLLTKIVKERDNGFKIFNISNGNFTTFVASDSSLSDEIKSEITTTIDYLDESSSIASAQDMVTKFSTLKTVFASDTFKDANKSDATVFTNIVKWAKKIVKASKDGNLTKPNIAQLKAIFTLSEDLNISNPDLNITDINTSSINLADIVVPDAIINHKKALVNALGVDIDITGKNVRDYYFKSTASTLNQTEELIKGMNDISITDELYVKIAQGYISNNELDKALNYAKSKVFQKQNKADIYRFMGEKLIGTDNTKAEELFDKALDLYKVMIEARGTGEMAESDVSDLSKLLQDYTLIDNTTKADNLTTYLNDKKGDFAHGGKYSAFANAYKKTADELIEKGEKTKAIAILKKEYDFLKSMPIFNKKSDPDNTAKAHYFTKIIYYVQIATRLAKNGEFATAVEIVDAAQAMRLNDGTTDNGVYNATYSAANKYDTSYKSYTQVDDMAAIYAMAGENQKALDLIPTLVKAGKESASYMQYAKGLAISDNMMEAFSVVDNNITDYTDKIKALTYNGVNKGGDYIAQYMIENGENAKAKQAIDKAIGILDIAVANIEESTATKRADEYVKYGYSKFANLYAMIGETALASTNFTKAIAIADGTYNDSNASIVITDRKYQVEALEEIADQLTEVNLIEEAKAVITNATEIAGSRDSIGAKLESYKWIMKSDGVYASKEITVDAMKTLIDGSGDDIGETGGVGDKNYIKIVDYLVDMAEALDIIGKKTKADTMLILANTKANLINKPSDKVSKFQKISKMYAQIGMVTKASVIVDTIAYKGDKRKAIKDIANTVYENDAFPESDIASVDTDKDGRPDFFDFGATQAQITASGLTLDDDNDGDNVLNQDDTTPFYTNN